MPDPAYGFLDRLLHRLALEYGSVAQMSFDVDQGLVGTDPAEIIRNRHVFVAGLARAGTTVLMRRFHATGLYRSLTYRDMPFVLAPNLWQRLSSISRREIETAERAHGDNVLVNVDSPESFEEVFWRVFSGDEYLRRDKLLPYRPSDDVIEQFIRYVNAILSTRRPRSERYLSKNNNNVVRLGAIRRAFPNAVILIPFRDPRQQAQSLFRQHRLFLEMQRSDAFTLSFMSWLGHHEFGADHRPFDFGNGEASPYSPDTLNYWLHQWCETYSWVAKSAASVSAVFVSYEDLCTNPECWDRIAQLAEIPADLSVGDSFKLSTSDVEEGADPTLLDRAQAIYDRMAATVEAELV